MTYNVYKDNAGGLHLAVLSGERCIYYLYDHYGELVYDCVQELKTGADPITDGWDGGEDSPTECYAQAIGFLELRNGSMEDVTDAY